jgi:Flp pilus assembly protein TadG
MKTAIHRSAAARVQRGVYAVEYAFVFLIFFTVLYAIICLGIVFTLRFAMQNAAEDGARAALRYQTSIAGREQKAKAVAEFRTSDLLTSKPTVVATVCRVEGNNCDPVKRACGAAWEQRCQITVQITAIGFSQLLPPLPSFAIPDALVVQASMLLDGRAL